MTGITTNPTNLLENTHFIHHPTSKLSQIHAKSFPISITLKYHSLEPLDLRIFWHPRRIFQGAHIFQKRQIQYRMHTYFQFVSLVRKKNTLLEKNEKIIFFSKNEKHKICSISSMLPKMELKINSLSTKK